MELLQVFQHSYLAVPEDDYEMCKEPINIILAYFGGIHIAFQPFFLNWALLGLYRRWNLQDRIEADLLQKLQLLGGCWLVVGCQIPLHYAYFFDTVISPPSTPDCPNYNWMRDGYDHPLDYTTPNAPGYACTYQSPSTNGHLAWVLPQLPTSYYMPGSGIHCFLMFCHMVLFRRRPLVAFVTFVGFLTGPMLAAWLTPSVNEQGAVWCFNACIQMSLVAAVFRYSRVYEQGPPKQIVHHGKQGETTLVYVRVPPNGNKEDEQRLL